MFFYGGTRKTRKQVGFVAEFCETCRAPRPFSISRLGVGEHAYGISLGSKQLSGYVGTCQGCQYEKEVNALHFAGFAKHVRHDVEGLVGETFPNFRRVYGHRLMLEEQLRSGQLPPADREVFFNEIFLRFALATERLLGGGSIQIRGRGGWGCLGSFAIAVAVVIIGNMLWLLPEQREHVMAAAVGVFLLGAAYSLFEMLREPKRLLRRKVIPELAGALRPLKPTKDEIAYCLEKMKRLDFKISGMTDADTLWAQAEQGEPIRGGA